MQHVQLSRVCRRDRIHRAAEKFVAIDPRPYVQRLALRNQFLFQRVAICDELHPGPPRQPVCRNGADLRRPPVDRSVPHKTVIAAARFLRHSELVLVCNIQVARNAFPDYGFKGNLPQALRTNAGRIFSRWGHVGGGLMTNTIWVVFQMSIRQFQIHTSIS